MGSRGFLPVAEASPGTRTGEGAALGQSSSSNTVIAVFRLVGSNSQGVMADCQLDTHEKPCHWPKQEPEAACLSGGFRMKDVNVKNKRSI